MSGEATINLDTFKPRPYQTQIFDAIENQDCKRVMAIWPRRAGKDLVAWNLCIRELLRSPKIIYYIFPTFAQGRRILWDNMTMDGVRMLDYLPSELIKDKNEQLMRIRLKNGSLFQVLGSNSYDNTVVGTNAKGVVFSEFALSDPMAYKLSRPILSANNGWALIISCVSPDTLIIGANGLKRIKDVHYSRSEYTDLNEPVYGLGGFHNAEQFYYGGKQDTFKIVLNSGYELECTGVHPIWNGKEWVKAKDLKVGDDVPVQYGQNVWGDGLDVSEGFVYESKNYRQSGKFPFDLDSNDFFYFLGLVHADGNFSRDTVCITNKKDPEIKRFLSSYGFITRPDGIHHEKSSRELCALLEFLGFKHGATRKTFPDKLFDCNKNQMRVFLQGLFDGDGCSACGKTKRGYVKLTSTCLSFVKDLQVVLLNFGIVSSLHKEEKAPTKRVKVSSTIYNLEIYGYFAHIFYRDIGFRLERKQKNWANVAENCKEESGNIYPTDASRLDDIFIPQRFVMNKSRISRRIIRKLSKSHPHPYFDELLKEKFFYSKIKSIIPSSNNVYDFVIPETHSFFSNGFISHNTPRGKNFMWDMYRIAKENPQEWSLSKLTVDDTKHIPMETIMKERELGEMSEDLQMQEYWTSFELGVEGAYYIRYIDQLNLRGQICDVPWDPSLPVHTAWDLGVNDMTVIIFFQVVGQKIAIIDFYDKNKEGIEYYVNYLKSKPYTYGEHICPHDIGVYDFSSSMTRWEKARQLGVNLRVAAKLSLQDGIEAVRSILLRTWIDKKKCEPLIRALENYRQEYDSKRKVYKRHPVHDNFSHACDAMRYLAIELPHIGPSMTAEDLKKLKAEVYREQYEQNAYF
jgi:intein/homing endonuclease